MKTKVCNKCKKSLPFDKFYPHKQGKYKLRTRCKKCEGEDRKVYDQTPAGRATQRRANCSPKGRKRTRKYYLRDEYDLTLEDFDRMVAEQNEVCAICGKPETTIHPCSGAVQRLSVDHNHITCITKQSPVLFSNMSLGGFMVDEKGIELLLNAINYINERDK